MAISIYLVVLMIAAWRPFNFHPMAMDAFRELWSRGNWIPFAMYVHERTLAHWRDIGGEIAWYLPLGMLLWARFSTRRRRFLAAMGLVLAVASILELGQCMIVGRYVDITDIIFHGLGGLAGYSLGGLFRPGDDRAR